MQISLPKKLRSVKLGMAILLHMISNIVLLFKVLLVTTPLTSLEVEVIKWWGAFNLTLIGAFYIAHEAAKNKKINSKLEEELEKERK